MVKRLLLSVAVQLAAFALFADEVDLAAAKEFAHGWRARAVRGARTHKNAAGESRFHVVSFEGGGWAAVGVDDEESPVIAFSNNGEDLVEDDKNPIWFLVKRDAEWRAKGREVGRKERKGRHKSWSYRREKVRNSGGLKLATATAKPAIGDTALQDVRVAPLLKSTWDQKTAGGYRTYNYYTPNYYYCGCVATMMAQIMRYFEWPKASVTKKTFPCYVGTTIPEEIPESSIVQKTMMGGVYDWEKMTLNPDSSTSVDSRQEIGKLCYDCGVSVSMMWSNEGSGAYTWFVREALVDTFRYSHAELVVFGDDPLPAYSLEKLKSIVIPNCEAGLPIGYGISYAVNGYSVGHAVVIDGYGYSGDDFYMHINPGWSGSYNAWYCPPNLAMGGHPFNSSDELVYNIYTEGSGALVTGRVLNMDGRPIAGATVSGTANGKSFSVTSSGRGVFVFKTGIDDAEVSLVVTAAKNGFSETKTINLKAAKTMRGNRDDPFAQSDYFITGYADYSLGNEYDFNFTLPYHTPAPKVLFR